MVRKRNIMALLLLATIVAAGFSVPARATDWTAVIDEKNGYADPGAAIGFISEHFRGIPYRAGTLGGGAGLPEKLTVRLDAVDCFTLLDYVEAIRRSETYAGFRPALTRVRYHDSRVDWTTRRHFFIDWRDDRLIADATILVGQAASRTVAKRLNEAADGTKLLPGIAASERNISFIPASAIDAALLRRLKTGDYIGIYSRRPGLDVSHVGILIRRDAEFFLRHASSRPEVAAVVDEELTGYLQGKPGIIVLRARPK